MTTTDRTRITLEISPVVAQLLDHISEITGTPKTQIVQSALLASLPDVLATADGLRKRSTELSQRKGAK